MTTLAPDCPDGVPPFTLGAPTIRYVGDAPAAAGVAPWRDEGPHGRTLDDGVLRLRVAIGPAPASAAGRARTLTLSATALRPARIADCAIELLTPCDRPPRLVDHRLAWRELRDDTTLGAITPLLLRWRDGAGSAFELRALRSAVAARLGWRDQTLRVRVHLDSAALHPRWSFADRQTRSTAAPVWEVGHELSIVLALLEPDDDWEAQPVLAARLPGGAEAALVITDHCDFDTVGRLHAFTLGDGRHPGWMDRGLRLTKGIFAIESEVRGRAPAPTVRDPTYRALIRRLHDDGSEIAPHGVNESGNVSPELFRTALAGVAHDFAPRTWIDHGLTLHYCYSMGGADHPEYALLHRLREHGITTLWSYHDAPVDAAASLDTAGQARATGARGVRAARHLARGRPLMAAHYLRSALRGRLEGPVGDAVGRSLSALRDVYLGRGRPATARVGRAAREVASALGALARGARSGVGGAAPHDRAALLAMSPVVYPERAVPLGQARADDMLLFATTEVLHTRDAYTPAAIVRLTADRGVHVGHCYLLNHLPYIAGIFADGDGARLGDGWAEFVDALAGAVAMGSVWNPPVCDLAEWLRAMQQVTTLPCARSAVTVHNGSRESLRRFTLLLPRAIAPDEVRWGDCAPAGWRTWHDWLAVWGDLRPETHTIVRWA